MLRDRISTQMEELIEEKSINDMMMGFDWDYQLGVSPQGEQLGLFFFVRRNAVHLSDPRALITCTVSLMNPFGTSKQDLERLLDHALETLDQEQTKALTQAQEALPAQNPS